MATINKIDINNYFLEKILDSNYSSTDEYFEISVGTHINETGVFIYTNGISWQANVISSTKILVVFSKSSLELIGYGRYPFEIRTIFANGHVSTLVKGDINIIPFA